jgi:hypothetical protein
VATPHDVDAQLLSRLVDRFTAGVLDAARLPPARASDVRRSCEISLSGDPRLLRLTCTITGSTYESPWDGSEDVAFSLVDEAADDTASLVARTPHYAWLRSRR